MKFAMMVLALFACYHCLFPIHVLAQTTPATAESCGASDFKCRARLSAPTDASQDATIQWLMGQVSALERKVKAAGAGVSREEVRDLSRQLLELADKVKALSDDLEAHKASSPTTPGPSPPATDILEGLNLGPRVTALEGRGNPFPQIEGLEKQIRELLKRLDTLEKRPGGSIQFDAGGFGFLSRGYMATGGLGAFAWSGLKWVSRLGFGAGQGLDWGGQELLSWGWLAKADILYRWEKVALGLTGTLIGGVVRGGSRYLSWNGGITARWTPINWLFVQPSVVSGVYMGTYDPLQANPITGLLEAGFTLRF